LTELELRKLYRTREDSGRAFMLELLQGPSRSREVLQPWEPCLSLFSTRSKLGYTLEAKLTLSSHFLPGWVWGIYRGLSQCFGQKWGSGSPLVRPAGNLGWPGGQVLWSHQLSHLGSSSYRLNMTHVESVILLAQIPGQLVKEWGRPATPLVGWAWAFSHIISRVILSQTTPGFGRNEDICGFWSIWYLSIIRCSWNGRSTKLIELISNSHLSSISCMKCRYVDGKYLHFMIVNTGKVTSGLGFSTELNVVPF
jgi:hypothetical protein